MNRTKKQESAIFVSFVLYTILFLSTLIVGVSYIVPQILGVMTNINTAQEQSAEIISIKKNGPEYDDIAKIKFLAGANTTLSQLIDKKFFAKYFENTTTQNYIGFLNSKKEILNNPEFIDKISAKEQEIVTILPSYIHSSNGEENEGFVSDFQFVNYIESILSAFQLKYTGLVWVWSLEQLEEYSLGEKNKNIYDVNIFRIPVVFTIEWYKKEILDFLYYTEKIGTISLEESLTQTGQLNLKVIEDSEWKFKVSRLKKYLGGKNVYKNQLFDINKLYMPEYIDASFTPRWGKDFVEFIKSDQWLKAFKMDIELYFYVKGIPKSKIEQELQALINVYKLSQQTIMYGLKTSLDNPLKKEIYTKMNLSLLETIKQIKILSSAKASPDIEKKYVKIQQYSQALNTLNKELGYENIYNIFINNYSKTSKEFEIIMKQKTSDNLYKQEGIQNIAEKVNQFQEKRKNALSFPIQDYQEMIRIHAIIESLK